MTDPLAAVSEWLIRLRAAYSIEGEKLLRLRYAGTPDVERERENSDLAERIKSTEVFLERQLAPRLERPATQP